MTKLTDAQWKALEKIAQPGGHGYGEYAYLSRSTAKALAKKGLVTLSYRSGGAFSRRGFGGRPWAEITDAGRELLRVRAEEREAAYEALLKRCDETLARCNKDGL